MPLTFAPNDRPTLGVELELCLVDRDSRELVSAASDVLGDLASPSTGGGAAVPHPKAKHELFECTVEIITGISGSVAEARADLQATLDELRVSDGLFVTNAVFGPRPATLDATPARPLPEAVGVAWRRIVGG